MVQSGVALFARLTDAEVGLKQSCSWSWARRCGLALVQAGVLAGVAAAVAGPVLNTEEPGPAAGSLVPPTQGRPAIGAGGLPPSAAPETSTGNKNLDLLLELQAKAGEGGAMAAKGASAAATPASAAAAAAAAKALAALRAKAAEQPPADDPRAPPAQPLGGGGLGLLDDDAKRGQPAERRAWSGQVGGGGGFDYRDSSREPSSAGRADNPLLRLPMELIAYLRENRFWVLGCIGGLVLLGAALKAYSRRV